MTTEPMLPLETVETPLAEGPVLDPSAIPDEVIQEEQNIIGYDEETAPAEPEVQVAGAGLKILREAARRMETPGPAEPMKTPLVQETAGEFIINAATPEEARAFKDALNLPEDAEIRIPLPNLTRQNLEEVQKDYINAIHQVFQDDILQQRRGKMTIDEIVKSAQSVGMDQVVAELLSKKQKRTVGADGSTNVEGLEVNPEQIARAVWARLNYSVHLEELMKNGTDEELLRFLPMAAAIEMQTAGAIAEAGRSMAVLSHAGRIGAMDVGRASSLPEIMKRYDNRGVTPETVQDIRAAYTSLPKQPAAKSRFMKTLASRGLDAWAEAYLNGLLSSPVTHAVNITSNAIFAGIQIPERVAAGVVGMLRQGARKMTRLNLGGPDRVYMMEGLSQAQSLTMGLRDAIHATARALRSEEPTFGVDATKIDARDAKAISAEYLDLSFAQPGTTLAKAIDLYGVLTRMFGSRLLLAEDEFFKGIGFNMELRSQALRQVNRAIEEGMSNEEAVKLAVRIMSRQDASTVESATDAARVMTFTNELGPWAGKISNLMSHPLAKIIVPFYRTPTNIVKETLQRSPLAIMPGSGFYTELKAGGARADAAIAKVVGYSGVFAYLAMLSTGEMSDDVFITGPGPTNKQAQAAWRRQKLTPNTVYIRQDNGEFKGYDFSRLAPIAGVMSMAAGYANYANYENDQDSLMEMFISSGAAMYDMIKEYPMLQGLFDISEILGSEYEGTTEKGKRFADLLAKQAGNALVTAAPAPTGSLTATIERSLNPLASDVSPSADQLNEEMEALPGYKGVIELYNEKMSRLPGGSDAVEEKLNLWAQPRKQLQLPKWDWFSPIRISTPEYNAVDAEMVRLNLGLRMPKRKQKGVYLSSDYYNQMLRGINAPNSRGETMVEEMRRVISEPAYQFDFSGNEVSNEDKLETLQQILTKRKKAQLEMMFAEGTALAEAKRLIENKPKPTPDRMVPPL